MLSYILIGIILLISNLVHCEDWPEPYFKDAHVEGITFGQFENNMQYLNVREEIKWPFKLVIINYNGNNGIFNMNFYTGSNIRLNATIEYENNEWYIQINNRQDYENPNQRYYLFDVEYQEEKHKIFINLENIFDVPPTITYEGPCRAEELKSNFTTNCTFHVTDEDGMKDNLITFKYDGQHNENEFLKLVKTKELNEYQVDYNLFIINELHYEDRSTYNFKIFVYDVANNSGNVSVILEIIDVPNLPPKWTKSFVTESFMEKTSQEFAVAAYDGDTGINKPIWYRLEFNENENYTNLFSINKTHGVLSVNPIDRDALKQEIFTFKICAYKYDNYSWSICDPPAVVIVQDINDHAPEITIKPQEIEFLENTFLTIPIEKFIVDDIDLGTHATYNVTISQFGNISYSEAFDIIPNSGYQKSDFRITVRNATLLDYEEPDWQNFDLKIIAQELNISEHKNEQILNIKLINWNDELPIFEKELYECNVSEIVGNNTIIATVTANDRDIGDKVIYEIVGSAEGLAIDKENGSIKTTLDRTFDHERQTSIIVQIRANDTLIAIPTDKIHSVYTQLHINVIDVNDKTPELRMPRKTPNITENSPGDTLITNMIIATDPDTTATLKFEIDWSHQNTYATKSGREAAVETYQNCFYIEAKEENRNKVYGLLKINPNFTKIREVDYEMYDTIYLMVRVTDKMQEVGEPSAEGILTVRIDDVNDNRPEFILDSLKEKWNIAEEAENNRIIGTVRAIDIDGPPFNIFNYTLRPSKDFMPLTLPDLVEIHNETGVIRVKSGNKIDCDIPKREYLRYVITLNDGIPPFPEREIKIKITDINNKKPQIENFENPVKILEKSKDGTHIGNIFASDLDRDYPHNALQYSINYKLFPNLTNFFEINTTSGEIKVKLLGNSILDRDKGESIHVIHVIVEDNYMGNGIINTNTTSLTVILLDINDNAPELPQIEELKIKENSQNNLEIRNITAPDIDDPTLPNSWVSYKILKIRPGHSHANDIENYDKLFRIESDDDKKTGHIFINQNLKGYYGSWIVEIQAYDYGDEGPDKKRMYSEKNYTFTVTPYNFHDPEIIYPKSGDILRLRYHRQQIGSSLFTADDRELEPFKAYDPDGGNCGNVTFKILSNDPTSGDGDYFKMHKESTTTSSLQITKEIQAKRYRINLVAEDEALPEEGGKRTSKIIENVIVVFIDMNQEPYFEKNEFNTEFTEGIEGMSEERLIPEAYDPKNEGIQSEKVESYYFIDSKYHPDDSKLFSLDKKTRILKLTQPLDRKKQQKHTIRVIVTNRADGPKVNQDENSLLLIHINVQGPPIFDEKTYGAGITSNDYISKVILMIHASSSNNKISYTMNKNEIVTHGENIEIIKTKIFNLEPTTGKLVLQEPPTTTMKGYFQFNISAIDDLNRTDTTNVKIYIVTEANRVKFIFYNDYEFVLNQTEFVKNSLKSIYGYDMCNIDEITKANSNNENTVSKAISSQETEGEYITSVRVHFIQNNNVVDAAEIQSKSSDIDLLGKLKRKLNEKLLYLNDIPQQKSENILDKNQNIFTIILSILSAILFAICIALGITLFLRTQAFNRHKKAFSDFESKPQVPDIDFHVDPTIIPSTIKTTTNIFTVNKTNPILNDKQIIEQKRNIQDTDTESFYSDDESDFVGIQNDPIFMTNEYMDGINPKIFSKRFHHMDSEKDTEA